MSQPYYRLCRELDICNELIDKYYNSQQYEKCFEGHLTLAGRLSSCGMPDRIFLF